MMELSDLNKIEFLKELTDEKIILLEKYMNFTLEENKKFNLTALDNKNDFIIKNIIELICEFICSILVLLSNPRFCMFSISIASSSILFFKFSLVF